MRKVVIGGVGMTSFGKFLDRNLKSLSEEAVALALKDARVSVNDVDRIFFGNAAAGVVTGQEMIRAQSSLRNTGLDGKPMFNVENACASGSSALNLAWWSVATRTAPARSCGKSTGRCICTKRRSSSPAARARS